MFTDAELESAAASIVRQSIRRPYDRNITRRTDIEFSDTQDAAAGVFLRDAGAMFYALLLAVNELERLRQAAVTATNDLITDSRRLLSRDAPVKRTNQLQVAVQSLERLAAAQNSRSTNNSALADSSGFQQFSNSSARFIEQLGTQLVKDGQVLRTAAEVRGTLPADWRALRDQYLVVYERAHYLTTARDDYEALRLPSRLLKSVMDSALSVLRAELATLQALDENSRSQRIRQTLLNTLAARSIVRGFSVFEDAQLFVDIEGTVELYADTNHPATPASIDSLPGPYVLVDTASQLSLTLDTGVSTNIQVPFSAPPSIDILFSGPYIVPTGRTDFNVAVYEDGDLLANVDISLPVNETPPYWAFEDMLAFMGTQVALIIYLEHSADILGPTYTGGASWDASAMYLIAPAGVDWYAAGINDGDVYVVDDHATAMHRMYGTVTVVSSTELSLTPLYLPLSGANEVIGGGSNPSGAIKIGPATNPVTNNDSNVFHTIRVKNAYLQQSVANKWSIRVTDIDQLASAGVGLYNGVDSPSVQTDSARAATGIQQSGGAALSGTPRVHCEQVYLSEVYSGVVSTTPGIADELVLAEPIGSVRTATLISVGTSLSADPNPTVPNGTLATIVKVTRGGNVIPITEDAVSISWFIRNILRFNGYDSSNGYAAGDVITFVFDTPTEELAVVIDDNSLIDGTYQVRRVDSNNSTLTLASTLPLTFGDAALPITANATLYQVGLRVASKAADLTSRVTINDTPTGSTLFGSLPQTVYGTTQWLKLPKAGKVNPGDQLELHKTNPVTPDFTATVLTVEGDLIQISTPLSVNEPDFYTSTTGTVPFARFRRAIRQNYETLAQSIRGWLLVDIANLLDAADRKIKAALAQSQPSVVQVRQVEDALVSLRAQLETLQPFLTSYSADVVPQVNDLLEAFRAKGADRAVDLLLQGRFQEFFGVDAENASYTGEIKQLARTIQREDLPVSRFGRSDPGTVSTQALIAAYDEDDPEYNPEGEEEDVDVDGGFSS